MLKTTCSSFFTLSTSANLLGSVVSQTDVIETTIAYQDQRQWQSIQVE